MECETCGGENKHICPECDEEITESQCKEVGMCSDCLLTFNIE